MESVKVTFYETPGHGYYRVSKSTFLKVGGDPSTITGFSFHNETSLYLEEDLDAYNFFELLKEKGITADVKHTYVKSAPCAHAFYKPDLFDARIKEGTNVVLHDGSIGTVFYVGKKRRIRVNVDGVQKVYRLPANVFAYVVGVA